MKRLLSIAIINFVSFIILGMLLSGVSNAEDFRTYTKSLQPGQYTTCDVYGPHSGLMREDGSTLGFDAITLFDQPSHLEADFMWFTSGWMAWDYPIDIPMDSEIQSISYMLEIASEYPGANWDWPSDITISINDIDIDLWTIPGDPDALYDYGFQENHLKSSNTQYGWLVTWTVDKTGTYFEYKFRLGDSAKVKVSEITIDDIGIIPGEDLRIKLSIPYRDEGYGLNIFGDSWGDHDHDPTITIDYSVSSTSLSIPADNISGEFIQIPGSTKIKITVEGQVHTNPGGTVLSCDVWTDPTGIDDCVYNGRGDLHGLNFMALIGKFDEGDWFPIGGYCEKVFPHNGYLQLKVNDFIYQDNAGSFTVKIEYSGIDQGEGDSTLFLDYLNIIEKKIDANPGAVDAVIEDETINDKLDILMGIVNDLKSELTKAQEERAAIENKYNIP